jgi:hypothetical protein
VLIHATIPVSADKSVPYEWTVYARGIDNEDITPFVKQVRTTNH